MKFTTFHNFLREAAEQHQGHRGTLGQIARRRGHQSLGDLIKQDVELKTLIPRLARLQADYYWGSGDILIPNVFCGDYYHLLSSIECIMIVLDRFPAKPLFQVQLIIRSPGLAYALNDFLEVISHLRREYNVTRIRDRR